MLCCKLHKYSLIKILIPKHYRRSSLEKNEVRSVCEEEEREQMVSRVEKIENIEKKEWGKKEERRRKEIMGKIL